MRTLGRGYALSTFKTTGTYHGAVPACKFIEAGRIGLTLVFRTTLLGGMLENPEVVAVNVVTSKYIGNEFQG